MPVRTAWRMHSRLGTGSMPGLAASTRLTCVLGSAPNAVAAPENSLALLAVICAWTSRPTTTSHSPVPPWIRYGAAESAICALSRFLEHDQGRGDDHRERGRPADRHRRERAQVEIGVAADNEE